MQSDIIPCAPARKLLANHPTSEKVEEFVEKDCVPADAVFSAELGEGEKRWQTTPVVIENLKAKAKQLGLWNMFLPKSHFKQGAGYTNLEYGLMAELLGKSKVASEVSPDGCLWFWSIINDRCTGYQ